MLTTSLQFHGHPAMLFIASSILIFKNSFCPQSSIIIISFPAALIGTQAGFIMDIVMWFGLALKSVADKAYAASEKS